MPKKFNYDKLRKFPKAGLDQDFSRLLISLNQSVEQKKNPALYQTIALLIRNIDLSLGKVWKWIEELEEEIESSSDSDTGGDYVVLSDGGEPPTLPINNGAGQFIYTAYNP